MFFFFLVLKKQISTDRHLNERAFWRYICGTGWDDEIGISDILSEVVVWLWKVVVVSLVSWVTPFLFFGGDDDDDDDDDDDEKSNRRGMQM